MIDFDKIDKYAKEILKDKRWKTCMNYATRKIVALNIINKKFNINLTEGNVKMIVQTALQLEKNKNDAERLKKAEEDYKKAIKGFKESKQEIEDMERLLLKCNVNVEVIFLIKKAIKKLKE